MKQKSKEQSAWENKPKMNMKTYQKRRSKENAQKKINKESGSKSFAYVREETPP